MFINIYNCDILDQGPFVNRMAGFSLYVSNTSNKDDGHLCYKDTTGRPSVNQYITCSVYGRYVIYYNERNQTLNRIYYSEYAFNELCEVEVYGKFLYFHTYFFFKMLLSSDILQMNTVHKHSCFHRMQRTVLAKLSIFMSCNLHRSEMSNEYGSM